MAFAKVVSERSVSRAHLDQRGINGRLIFIWHFYVFDFNESPARESLSLPAPTTKKKEDNTATSVSRPVLYIPPPPPQTVGLRIWMSVQPRLLGESAVM